MVSLDGWKKSFFEGFLALSYQPTSLPCIKYLGGLDSDVDPSFERVTSPVPV